MKPFVVIFLLVTVTTTWNIVDGWKQCPSEEGGGICPLGNTCCPTETPGISACISGREKDPEGARGQCCDLEGTTGCAYGYDCALRIGGNNNGTSTIEQQPVCKLRESHPEYLNAKETPRYELCRLPSSSLSSETLRLQRFPIGGFNAVYYSSMGSILHTTDDDDNERHSIDNDNNMQKFSSIETVLVIVHGSGRNADDYLCTGISTAMAMSKRDENNNNSNRLDLGSSSSNDSNSVDSNSVGSLNNRKVLVIAPKFVADVDHDDRSHYRKTLYWLEKGKDVPLGHTWRYGADAANTHNSTIAFANTSKSDNGDDDVHGSNQNGISSYAVMDRLLEFLIASKQQINDEERSVRDSLLPQKEKFHFPNLKRIVVAGHSAGGQYVHRWALLSSSPVVWGDGSNIDNVPKDKDDHIDINRNKTSNAENNRNIEIRAIVANPRSYCYPDNRRMIRTDAVVTSESDRLGNETIGVDVNVTDVTRIRYRNIDVNIGIDEQHSYVFALPDSRDVNKCPTYNQWQWGLDSGGDVISPYKDAALDNIHNNMTALALRYSKRKVFYLAGEHDTLVQEDRCETYGFQGDTRNERARRYFRALAAYLTTTTRGGNLGRFNNTASPTITSNNKLTQEFHQVPGSPHDHTLMFQSAFGREAFYGENRHERSNMGDIEIYHNDKAFSNETNLKIRID